MKYVIAFFVVLGLSVALGLLSKNWFLEFGLLIVVTSSIMAIITAIRNSVLASQAKKRAFEDFLPPSDDLDSYSFKFTASIMGVNTKHPFEQLRREIDELQKVAIQDEKNFRQGLRMTNRRIDICLAQIRFHEAVTLPNILGGGAGLIIFSSVLTIIGSIYSAFPDASFAIFSRVAGVLIGSHH